MRLATVLTTASYVVVLLLLINIIIKVREQRHCQNHEISNSANNGLDLR